MPFAMPAIRMASWNIRSLLHHLPHMAQAKGTQVLRLLSQHDLVYLQAVRGGRDTVVRAIDRYAATHVGRVSTRHDGAARGVAVWVSKLLASQAHAITTVDIIPGRVLRDTLTRGDSDRLDRVNIHNEGLTRAD